MAEATLPEVPVSQAFSLGWNISRLYQANESPCRRRWQQAPDRLPSLGRLSEAERSLVRLGQIKAEIGRLEECLASGDGRGTLRPALEEEIAALDPKDDGSAGGATLRESLCRAHLSLAHALSCSDSRLAKAYQLGVSLATTCYGPTDDASLKQEFNKQRVAQLGEWLADLTALFPEHAGRAVRISCNSWRRWVENPKVRRRRMHRAKQSADVDWKQEEGREVRRSLARQGEIWRALLADEKPGTAMLELRDYVAAGGRALRNGAGLARRLWPWLLLALLLLLGGLFLFVRLDSAGYQVAGLAAVVGSVGLTWKGIFGGIGSVMSKLQQPVWGAALDEQIASAITILPARAVVDKKKAKQAAPAAGPQPGALPLLKEVEAKPEWAP